MEFESIWPVLWGGLLIGMGVYWIKKRSIGIGIEGRPAFFYIKGKGAIIWGILVIVAGVIILLKPEIISFLSFKF